MESWPVILDKRILRIALAAPLAVLLTYSGIALGQDQRSSRSTERKIDADPEGARRAYSTNCAGCHGLDGRGGERAPDIVTRPNIRQLSDVQLLQILQKGVPQTSMPAFSHLGDDVLRSLVTHLRALQGNPATTPLPGNARRGRELFFGKGGCSGCHMVRGQGGFFASDLSVYSRGRTPQAVHDAIVFPNRDLDPRNRTVVATLPRGKTLEGIARNEDNFSIQLLAQDGTLHLLSKTALVSLTFRNESAMPADYGTRLSASELDDLVNYLASIANKESKKKDGEDYLNDE